MSLRVPIAIWHPREIANPYLATITQPAPAASQIAHAVLPPVRSSYLPVVFGEAHWTAAVRRVDAEINLRWSSEPSPAC